MDQHFCCRRSNLSAVHPLRGLDITLAYLPSHHRPLPPIQPVFGRRTVHPPRKWRKSRGLSVLRLPRSWSERPVTRSIILGHMDQIAAQDWRVSNRSWANSAGRWGWNGAISKGISEENVKRMWKLLGGERLTRKKGLRLIDWPFDCGYIYNTCFINAQNWGNGVIKCFNNIKFSNWCNISSSSQVVEQNQMLSYWTSNSRLE